MSLKIYTVPCRVGYMDNYSYILIDEASLTAAVMDPSEAAPIIAKLTELGLRPQFILNTHHHFDHTDANLELKELYGAKVVGNQADEARLPGFDLGVTDGGTFKLGQSEAEIIDVSAHTQGHILWYFKKDKALFTGDTLFNLCIGGLFEGTDAEMFTALQKIKNMPDDVLFYPGHEYTLHAALYAQRYNKGNDDITSYIKNAEQRLRQKLPVGPIPLGIEKKCNPYLEAETLNEFRQLT